MKREEVKEVFEQWDKFIENTSPTDYLMANKDALRQKFLNEHYPEPLEVGKWYKSSNPESDGFIKIQEIDKKSDVTAFGFDSNGEWNDSKNWGSLFGNEYHPVLATKEEVDEALLNYARNRGYKNGNYKCLSGMPTTMAKEDSFLIKNTGVWQGENGSGINLIFDAIRGKWAEIIEPKVIEPLLSYDITECSSCNKDAYRVVNIETCPSEDKVTVKFESKWRTNDIHVISGDLSLLTKLGKLNAWFEIKVKK